MPMRALSDANEGVGVSWMKARVVACGVDTLELFTRHPVSRECVDVLERARLAAQESHGAQPLNVDGVPGWESWAAEGVAVSVEPHGARGARYLLTGDLYSLRVQPLSRGGQATVHVEVRALALWSQGWEQAADRAVRLIRALCGGEAVSIGTLDVQCGRVDLAADVQLVGGQLGPDCAREFVGRVRRSSRGRHWCREDEALDDAIEREARAIVQMAKELEKATSSQHRMSLLRQIRGDEGGQLSLYGDELAFSGFTWGAGGPLSARCYDKTRELSVSRKQWMRTVWARVADYEPEATVWRIEYQLRREGVRQVRVHEVEAGTDSEASSWASVRAALPAMWRYLTRDWLSCRRPRSKMSRREYREWWLGVMGAWPGLESSPVEVWRETVREASAVTVPALAGYLASAVSQVEALRAADGRDALPYSAALVAVLRAAHEYREKQGESIQARSHERAVRLVARRWTMEGRGSRAACGALRKASLRRAAGVERRGEDHALAVPQAVQREPAVARHVQEWLPYTGLALDGGRYVTRRSEPREGRHRGFEPVSAAGVARWRQSLGG